MTGRITFKELQEICDEYRVICVETGLRVIYDREAVEKNHYSHAKNEVKIGKAGDKGWDVFTPSSFIWAEYGKEINVKLTYKEMTFMVFSKQ